jgi:hypothetical protein
MPVQDDLPILLQEAESQATGLPIEAAGKLVWRGGESPAVSSASEECLPNASSPTAVCRGGGLNTYQPVASDGRCRR